MNNGGIYLFTSERLGFRNWRIEDTAAMAAINADRKVMEYFPAIVSVEQTRTFIDRMRKQYDEKGFCYFAVEKLEASELIGFIGLSEQTYQAPFTPCIDIGWRLKRSEWSNGYATEGAKRCLQYAFEALSIEKINAVAPKVNERSINVMKKIGMKQLYEFEHPLLAHDERLRNCVLFELSNCSG